MKTGIATILDQHITVLETLMDKYKLPLPTRPPKNVHTSVNSEVLRDELMFRLIFTGIQNFLDMHIKGIRNLKSDSLREIFMGFLEDEVRAYDDLVKYSKLKGWIQVPPQFNQQLS